MSKSYKHLTERAAEYGNISDSLDYVLRGKRKNTWYGRWILAHRERVVRATQTSILGGTFQPRKYREHIICERGKTRIIQSVTILRSIGIHAVMKVVEHDMDKALVADTAASIKGRGGHYLLRRMMRDMRRSPAETSCVYKDDIEKFYQSTSQDVLMAVVRRKIRDRRMVRILERWVRILPTGISIGMRPSQGLENLLLSEYIDHVVKDREAARYYRRYCDDKVVQAGSFYSLTHYARIISRQTEAAGLRVKANAQMWRTGCRPVDFLGYIVYADGHVRIRKSTKQRFARKWSRVRSRRRRRELIGSFYGLCRHANAQHLFRKLTGLDMHSFADIGFTYQRDGKKEFSAPTIKLRSLANVQITVKDFETEIKTREGEDRYVVLIETRENGECKFFTHNEKMKKALDMARDKNMLPFTTVIRADGGYGYIFT